MKIVCGGVHKTRVEKMGVKVIPRGLGIFVEAGHGSGSANPCARLRSGGAVIKIVIDDDGRLVFVGVRFVYRDQAARSRVNDVVGKNVVGHVPLHLELAGAGSRSVVVVQSVVDYRAVSGVSALGRIASDGNTCGVAVVDKIVPGSDVAGGAVFVLTG